MIEKLPEPRDFGHPPSLAEMEAIAYQELVHIPEELRRHCAGLAIRVEDFAQDDVLADMGIESPFDLMGLYHGIPLTQRTTAYGGVLPDRITIYRLPISRRCRTLDEVVRQVQITVVHEVAHHFGIDDERLHELGWA